VLKNKQAMLRDNFGADWQWVDKASLREQIKTERYHAALYEPNAMHFHPLKYAQGIAKACHDAGVKIFEQSAANHIEKLASGWKIHTAQGSVTCKTLIMCCGGYLSGLRPKVDAAVLPIATYVMVTESLGDRLKAAINTQAAVYDTRFAFDYYRALPDSRILWGGRISVLDRSPESVKRLLYRDMLKVFPQMKGIKIDHAWSGLMSYARHEMPQIAQIESELWVGQAFGGHGVGPTTLAGEVVASAIAENDQRWKAFSNYGMPSTLKPAGFVGAQLAYWWYQAKDFWNAAKLN
jgi:gamma-glutamylputrescine oxidase